MEYVTRVIFPIFAGLMLLLGGCAHINTATPAPAKPTADDYFNKALDHVGDGNYELAYASALEGEKSFADNGVETPERYTALLKLTAQISMPKRIRHIRNMYYSGNMFGAKNYLLIALRIASKEGLEFPFELERIMRNVFDDIQDLYLIEEVPVIRPRPA